LYNTDTVYGRYFVFHSIYSYTCIAIGLSYLLYYSIKNSGLFSKQSFLVILGTIVPLGVNMIYTMKVIELTTYSTPVSFAFSIICYSFAIFKFKFLNITPIALQAIVDRISDSFIVINENHDIIDYNRTFIDSFGSIVSIRRSENLSSLLKENKLLDIDECLLFDYIKNARDGKRPISFEWHAKSGSFDRFFTVEITPIIEKDKYLGTIILLKDITQSKLDLETIKKNQEIIMEQERLASLGQLIGGIAHNIKTPIMSIAGGIEALKDLVKEYDESIDDIEVTAADHHEIAREMQEWLNKMKPYCTYMSDIITAVKGQAVQLNDSSTSKFTVEELVKRIEILMMHELKRYHCILKTYFQIDLNTEIKGEVNNLVQIFDNIIINAIHSYEGNSGEIVFKIVRTGDSVEFSIRDYGAGIPDKLKNRLFKEMITTKGKNGTGLGLYMSYSTIKGRFGGNMWFTSKEGGGTTFFIAIPCLKAGIDQEVS
jgi:signal transduction histidine kinase